MTSSGTSAGSADAPATTRRATRSAEDSYLGGVAGGLAGHLGLDPLYVRAFFVVTGFFGFGVLLYAGLWMTLPLGAPAEEAPGLAAATRQGKRTGQAPTLRDAGPLVALAALVLGAVVLLELVLGGGRILWPMSLAVVGLGVLWWQADEAQRERWLDSTGRVDLLRLVVGDGGVAAWTRLAAGVGLLVVALMVFALQTGDVSVARDVVVAGVLGVIGLALTLGPWLFRLAADLSEEREARVRSQERADVAAHLHDSVLQTLALIRRSADDPAQVGRLARAQERDLRQWMYGEQAAPGGTLATALKEMAADVEDAHGVPVEVVTVGDTGTGDALVPLVQAAREAVVNAAKHSGAPRVDVYAEVAGEEVSVFVRDRGRGFDPAAVGEDRLGVRRSIEDRMRRHGGKAVVRSAPGEGTEVRLTTTMGTTSKDRRGRSEESR